MKMRCHNARKNISLALDERLRPSDRERLQQHLQACPSCRGWQTEQRELLELMRARQDVQPSPDFYAGLQGRIASARDRRGLMVFSPPVFRPGLLRAAMFLVVVFSAVFGFFLGGRLEAPAAGADAAVFYQTLNLDAFTDLPADSFGAVYDSLLHGELQ